MPTITTTIESGTGFNCTFTASSGADVTASATTSGAGAGDEGGPSFFNGSLCALHFWKFTDAAQKATFIDNFQPIIAYGNNNGHSLWGYIIDTGGLTLETPICWDGEACFLKVEAYFGGNAFVQSIIGKMEVTAYFVGDVTQAVKDRLAEWDQAPGCTCIVKDCLANGQRLGGPMPSDAMGVIMRQQYSCAADLEANWDAWKPLTAMVYDSFDTNITFKISDTESCTMWLGKSKQAQLNWFKNLQYPAAAAALAEWMPKMTYMGGTTFGNTADPEIAAHLANWPTFPSAPIVGGTQGGSSIKVLNKWVYDGKAKRDAAFALMNKVVPPAGNTAIWVGFPVGECSIYVTHQAKDIESSTALSAAIGSNPEILAALTDVIGGSWYNFGNGQANFKAEVDKWADVIPCLIEDPNAKLVTSIGLDSHSTNYNSDGLISIHDVKYNAAGDIHKWADLLNTPAVIQLGQAAGMSASVFQTSSTTGINVFNFASQEQWLTFNEGFSAHAGDITAWVKDLNAYWIGDTNGEKNKAAFAAWNEAAWCNLMTPNTAGVYKSSGAASQSTL